MSSVKPLCKKHRIKSLYATDRRWIRKQASRSSPERLRNLRPSSLRNSKDEELKSPKLSIAIGWNIWSDKQIVILLSVSLCCHFRYHPHASCCSVHIRLSQCAYYYYNFCFYYYYLCFSSIHYSFNNLLSCCLQAVNGIIEDSK